MILFLSWFQGWLTSLLIRFFFISSAPDCTNKKMDDIAIIHLKNILPETFLNYLFNHYSFREGQFTGLFQNFHEVHSPGSF